MLQRPHSCSFTLLFTLLRAIQLKILENWELLGTSVPEMPISTNGTRIQYFGIYFLNVDAMLQIPQRLLKIHVCLAFLFEDLSLNVIEVRVLLHCYRITNLFLQKELFLSNILIQRLNLIKNTEVMAISSECLLYWQSNLTYPLIMKNNLLTQESWVMISSFAV